MRQPLPAPLSVRGEELVTESINAQYEALILDFQGVTLEATDAVAQFEGARRTPDEGSTLIKLDSIVEVCLSCHGRHWSDVGCPGCRRYYV